MLSLGNFYFSSLNSKDERYQDNLKNSYKFYHLVLTEDVKNIYAANGLGMVCAERGELNVAKDIFSRVRFFYYSTI
jgi:RNA polymerase-associated protein CTR9